ncbi:MAG: hypothetical protein NTW78_00610 [Campylobacterales bacterium]|nr:hypothetical protein [Campylobacterales bacterium]
MSIGAIGNTIYVNQQTATVSSVQGNFQNRLDIQNVAAQSIVNEEEQKILEIRPAEGNHEVDPDREHERDEADQENKRGKKQKKEEAEEDETVFSEHKLDIKV